MLINVLAKEMPVLKTPGAWEEIVDAVAQVFRDGEAADARVIERYRPGRTVEH